jgi:hypothetical protein
MKRFLLLTLSSTLLLIALPVAQTAVQHATASIFVRP